jgi:Fe2+ or Zn2+ uptake regulation protein
MERMTRQRKLILRTLENRRDHPTAEMVFDSIKHELPGISLGTVYRNLNIFCREGLVQIVSVPGEPNRFDANIRNHGHIRCTRCGRIEDLPEDVVPRIDGDRLDGFIVTRCRLDLEGLCRRCRVDIAGDADTISDAGDKITGFIGDNV